MIFAPFSSLDVEGVALGEEPLLHGVNAPADGGR